MGRWFGKEDVPIGERVKWLAGQQAAGKGTVIDCGMCGGDGMDPEDPGDNCPRCRGTGAVLSENTGDA
jgi:hypothetical protein